MSTAHIFTANHQPATRFLVAVGNETKTFRLHGRTRVWARCCQRFRWAKYCTTQVYYDAQPFWCRKGRGCKVKS